VLRGACRLSPQAVSEAIERLMMSTPDFILNHLHLEPTNVVRLGVLNSAMLCRREGMDLAGALHLLRSEGCRSLLSVDRSLIQFAVRLGITPPVRQLMAKKA